MFKKSLKIIFLIGLALVAVGAVFFVSITRGLPDPSILSSRQIFESTKIYDRTGEILLYEIHGEEKRTTVPFEEIPEHIKQAAIAIEDEEFYSHAAIDPRGIIRAFITNITTGRVSQGGSTITQQLAKKAFLSDERTITRKIKELVLSLRLEKEFTKDEILGLYLNQIPYGANAYGIEAAAQTFFNKSSSEVTLAEAALLASLPNAPSYYSPWGYHVDELYSRKDFTLDKMFQAGYIDEEERDRAKNQEFEFAQRADVIKAPHFVIAVQEYLNKKYGETFVETSGLKVITTLDWDLQQIAEASVTENVERNEELYGGKNGALVAEDPKTGQILAMVGSKDYFDVDNQGNFNVATQGLRQPGSTMKPFAYVTAFKKGFTPETIVFDLPTEFAAQNPDCPSLVSFSNDNEECYHPENFDGIFRGPVTLREGLAQSINIPSIKVLYLAGLDDTLALARDFGLSTLTERSRYGLSLVLGGGEIKLNELVNAYSVFANEGIKNEQTMILSVSQKQKNKERVLEKYENQSRRVLDENYARIINDVLSDIETRSVLFENSLGLTVFSGRDVALKTGTTNDYRDAWSIGYSPSLVVGVWAGNNDNTPMKQRGSSLLAAIPMWNSFMREALNKYPEEFFTRPTPSETTKLVLNGKYLIDNKVHSILYYVDKKDPLGPAPLNPQKDSQFANWEEPVQTWVLNNIDLLASILQSQLVSGEIKINIISPENGSFVSSNETKFLIDITSQAPLSKIEVFLNGSVVDSEEISGTNYRYTKDFFLSSSPPQNEVEVFVTNQVGDRKSSKLILFN